MKIHLVFLLLMSLVFATNVRAQLIVEQPHTADNITYSNTTAKMLTELTLAIKADAYVKTFAKEKKEFVSKSATVTTPAQVSQTLIALSNYIKPNKFKSSFKVTDFAKNAGKITSLLQAKSLLKTFEAGLLPDAFVPIWKMQRSNWLNTAAD